MFRACLLKAHLQWSLDPIEFHSCRREVKYLRLNHPLYSLDPCFFRSLGGEPLILQSLDPRFSLTFGNEVLLLQSFDPHFCRTFGEAKYRRLYSPLLLLATLRHEAE